MNVDLEAEVRMKTTAKRLSDEVLMERLGKLVGSGRRITARVIVYLAEVKSRKLHLRQAYASLTDFCRRRLRMSDGEAYRRVVAATLVVRFPIIRRLVSRGDITLTTLVLLRDHLTEDNHPLWRARQYVSTALAWCAPVRLDRAGAEQSSLELAMGSASPGITPAWPLRIASSALEPQPTPS